MTLMLVDGRVIPEELIDRVLDRLPIPIPDVEPNSGNPLGIEPPLVIPPPRDVPADITEDRPPIGVDGFRQSVVRWLGLEAGK